MPPVQEPEFVSKSALAVLAVSVALVILAAGWWYLNRTRTNGSNFAAPPLPQDALEYNTANNTVPPPPEDILVTHATSSAKIQTPKTSTATPPEATSALQASETAAPAPSHTGTQPPAPPADRLQQYGQ